MSKIFMLLVAMVVSLAVIGQDNNDYIPLKSEGKIPQVFLEKSSDIVESQLNNIKKEENKKDHKSKEKFIVQSTFGTDKVLRSGQVLFNDPVTVYINKVAEKLFEHDKSLLKKLNIYAFKSTSANAYTFNDGTILVNLGLIAQLENESQLAFVLAHEVSHYLEQDAQDEFIESQNIMRGRGAYKQLSYDEKELLQYKHSKDIESRADEEGLEMFLKSDYSRETIHKVFDVLKYSYLPFDDEVFEVKFFENRHFKIPKEYLLEEVALINPEVLEEDYDEDRSTHPKTDERKEVIEGLIGNKDDQSKLTYLVSEETFKLVQKKARFELSRSYLLHGAYEEAIYNSYLLLRDYPDNIYVHKNIAKALHMMLLHVNNNENLWSNRLEIEDDIQGESQQLYYMLDKLADEDEDGFNAMVVAKIYEILKKFPEDKELKELFYHSVNSMVNETNLDLEYFSETFIDDSKSEELIEKKDTTEDYNKYAKIESQLTNKKKALQKTPHTNAFIEYLQDDVFKDAFDKVKVVEVEEEEDYSHIKNIKKRNKAIAQNKTKVKNKLGIEKLVIIEPAFIRINAKKKESYKYFESEEGQAEFNNALYDVSSNKKIGLDVSVLDTKDMQSDEMAKLNDIFLAKEWFNEQITLEEEVEYSNIEQERIDALVEKYDTEYFMWTGVISLKDQSARRRFLNIMVGIYATPALLYTIPKTISKTNYTLNFNIVFNFKTGDVVYATFNEINYKTSKPLLNSQLFQMLKEIESL